MDERRIIYHHQQTGFAVLLGMASGLVPQVVRAVSEIRKNRRKAWLYAPVAVVYGVMAYVFSTLTVEIDERTLQAGFAWGFARRSVDLAEIDSAAVSEVPWYVGWGVRYSKSGWLYRVGGRGAVEVNLKDGRRFSIGSDEPEALKAAVDAAVAAAGE